MTTQNERDAIKTSNIRAMYRELRERSQRRLLEHGPQCLAEIELLALVLPGSNSRRFYECMGALMVSFGSLRGVITAERQATSAQGLSDAQYAALHAAMELARRHYQQLMTAGPALSNPRVTREFLRMRLRDLAHEVFAIVYLDNRNRVLGFEELFRGTIDGASVYPREVVRSALARNAAAVILAHNHPSGVAEPSADDERITRRLKEALGLVDIRVLDHLIVGDAVCESFAERGLL